MNKKSKKETITLRYGNRTITFDEDYFRVPEDYTNLYLFCLGFCFGLSFMISIIGLLSFSFPIFYLIYLFYIPISAWIYSSYWLKKQYDEYTILKLLPYSFYLGMFGWIGIIKNWIKTKTKK